MKSVLVIGGGLVGLGTAWRVLERRPGLALTLLEKEPQVGAHQSTHNSGVLHCGLYYRPGSAKARLAVEGIRQMVSFCRTEQIPHDICGKLVVATTAEELPRLEELLRRGAANGLQGLRRLEPGDMRRIEPHVAGLAAAHVPEEGIVDYRAVCDRLAVRIQERGGKIQTRARVTRLERRGAEWVATTPAGELVQDFHLVTRDHALHVLNAPSPAATAALAIGAQVVGLLPAEAYDPHRFPLSPRPGNRHDAPALNASRS